MRIIHINTVVGRGGAAISTQTLCDEQRRAGHDSWIFACAAFIDHEHTFLFSPRPDPSAQASLVEAGLQDYEFQGSHDLTLHPLVASADVVHCHNLHGGFFNPYSLIPLAYSRPVIWTFRDMHPITGHCINSKDCDRWLRGCGACPYLAAPAALKHDSTATLWQDKALLASFLPITVVCPSVWMLGMVKRSYYRNHPAFVVPNGTEVNLFRPMDTAAAKQVMGIAPSTPVIGTVAEGGVANPWKGGAALHDVAGMIRAAVPHALVISIGNEHAPSNGKMVDGVFELPRTHDRQQLASWYSALDCYLSVSTADNCPVSVIEAMSAGLPVVAFGTGGIPELVRDGTDGIVVPPGDVADIARACASLFSADGRLDSMRRSARERAVARFAMARVRSDYASVYADAIQNYTQRRKVTREFDVSLLPEAIRTPRFLAALSRAGLT